MGVLLEHGAGKNPIARIPKLVRAAFAGMTIAVATFVGRDASTARELRCASLSSLSMTNEVYSRRTRKLVEGGAKLHDGTNQNPHLRLQFLTNSYISLKARKLLNKNRLVTAECGFFATYEVSRRRVSFC